MYRTWAFVENKHAQCQRFHRCGGDVCPMCLLGKETGKTLILRYETRVERHAKILILKATNILHVGLCQVLMLGSRRSKYNIVVLQSLVQ